MQEITTDECIQNTSEAFFVESIKKLSISKKNKITQKEENLAKMVGKLCVAIKSNQAGALFNSISKRHLKQLGKRPRRDASFFTHPGGKES